MQLLRPFTLLVLVAALTVPAALAVTPVYVDDGYTESTSGWGVDHFKDLQPAIDAVDAGGVVNVYPGTYDRDAALDRDPLHGGAGTVDMNVFVDKTMTIQGVDAGGAPITDYDDVAAYVIGMHLMPSMGESAVFVQADDVVITGLDIMGPESENNKNLETNGENITVKYCKLHARDGAAAFYIQDWRFDPDTDDSYIENYRLEANYFDGGGTWPGCVRIASGTGWTGLASGRVITGNTFANTCDGIQFVGPGGDPWDVYPVGTATITNNNFTTADRRHVVAWGKYGTVQGYVEPDWDAIFASNTFDKGTFVRTSGGECRYWDAGNFYYVRGIYGGPQAITKYALPKAQAGDTIELLEGTYAEQVTIDKLLTLDGAGTGTVIDPPVNGPGITIAVGGTSETDRVVVKDLKVTGATGGGNTGSGISVVGGSSDVSHITVENVESSGNDGNGFCFNHSGTAGDVVIDDCDLSHNGLTGFRVPSSLISLDGLTVTGGHMDGNAYGWEWYVTNVPEPGLVTNVSVTGTTFNDNSSKGIYVERLDHAIFDGIEVSNSGTAGDWASGIDINLKFRAYQDITIQNSVVTGCGAGDATNGVGITVKARDDGGTYGANPATLTGVDLIGCTVTDCQNGVRFGEPTKNNAGPTDVTVTTCLITGSTGAGMINETQTHTTATCNWWGGADGPNVPPAETVTGDVGFAPWLTTESGPCDGTANLVFNPTPLEITSADLVGSVYQDFTYVRYLGGGSAALYGYSIEIVWDHTKAELVLAELPETGPFAGAALFQVVEVTDGDVIIDAAIGGANPGTYGPADLCKLTFQAAGCAATPTLLDLTINSVRDSDNDEITGIDEEDGGVAVDITDPTVSAVSIVRTNAPDTGYVKNGDDIEIAVTITDTCGDVSGFLAAADLSELLVSGGTAVPPTTYEPDGLGGYVATWVLSDMVLTSPDGTKLVDVSVEDPLGSTTTVTGSTIVDNTAPPNAVSALDAAPGHNECVLTWTNPTGDPDLECYGIMVRRTEWGDYPEYDATEPEYPHATTGTEVYSSAGMVATYTNTFASTGAGRDICYYRVFVIDAAYNVSAETTGDCDRATNYWLGDVAPNAWPTSIGDGYVETIDVAALGLTYRVAEGGGTWDPHCDVGPTDDHGRLGIPEPDNQVEFEDLMIFAMNYGVVAPLTVPPTATPDAPRDGLVAFSIQLPDAMNPGSEFEARVMLSDEDGVVQGARFVVTYDANVVEYLGARPGSLVQGVENAFFMPVEVEGQPDISAAALGGGATFGHSGELAKLRFRVVGEGTISLGLQEIVARNSLNEDLFAGSSDVVEAPGEVKLPAEVFLHSAQPNPFAGATTLSYGLPEAAPVKLAVYDVGGRLVRVLAEGMQAAGEHPVLWDGRDETGSRVATGLYLYRLETKAKTITRKLIVTE